MLQTPGDENAEAGEEGDGFRRGTHPLDTRMVEKAISALAISLDLRLDRQSFVNAQSRADTSDPIQHMIEAAEVAGVFLRETPYRSAREALAAVRQGYSIVFLLADRSLLVLERPDGRKVEASLIGDVFRSESLGPGRLSELLGDTQSIRMLVAKRELECETLSGAAGHHGDDDHHEHPSPVARFIALLDLDRRDIGLVVLFAGVAGILALATPLVIEGLVNVVSWGTYFQPLLVLAGMLLVCLGIAGVLKVLQTWVVETIQRRQFVRIVSDLAHRFPRANQRSLLGQYPRELANRVFDIMTIQKATAILLLDGISIVLTTVLGLFLLAFYHPFLLGFDIVLVLTMISFTWILGRGGIKTAINESRTKYAVAHWLQDVLSMPSVFKTGGGESLAVQRANQLTSEYVKARKKQFRVVIRQVIFAVSLQVAASTALLGLGGWLVIDGQLTLGQLVASELVVTVVVGAFAKAGKSLEKFYDMMAGIDKVGHLLDIPPDPRMETGDVADGPSEVRWSDLTFTRGSGRSSIPGAVVRPGARVAIVGNDQAGKSMFARSLAGLVNPQDGTLQVGGFDAFESAIAKPGETVGYAGPPQIFHGTLSENVGLGRERVHASRVREVLAAVNLNQSVLAMPKGADAPLQSDGYPLTFEQQCQLMIARAIAPHPSVLVIDGLLDGMSQENLDYLFDYLRSDAADWTTILVTNHDRIADWCDQKIAVRSVG